MTDAPTEPKTPTSQCGEESARCRASNRPLQPSASSPSTPPSTTSSTRSDTSSAAPPSDASARRLIRPGTVRLLRLDHSCPQVDCTRPEITCQSHSILYQQHRPEPDIRVCCPRTETGNPKANAQR